MSKPFVIGKALEILFLVIIRNKVKFLPSGCSVSIVQTYAVCMLRENLIIEIYKYKITVADEGRIRLGMLTCYPMT